MPTADKATLLSSRVFVVTVRNQASLLLIVELSLPNKVRFKMEHSGPMSCRAGSPSRSSKVDSVQHSGNWDSGFFDVCASGFFQMCQAHFCPCITYAQNERSLQMREHPDHVPSRWGYAHQIPWYCCLLCCGAHCFMHQRYRDRIRALYQIKSGSLGDSGDFALSWYQI
jgi:hypothetical protein